MKVNNCLYCDSKRLTAVNRRSDNVQIIECAVCHVMMVDNISDNTESLYTADYFEKPEDTKSGYTNYLSSPVANMIGKFGFTSLFAKDPTTHLDLGCADGSLIEIFKSEGYDSRGLEISKDAVKIANIKGLDVRFSNLHSFPEKFPRSSVITAFDLLEHADKPGNVLREVYKNLENNGYFVFSTLSVKKHDSNDYWFNHSLEHYVYYDVKSLTYILEDIFGKGRFAFFEVQINGISEFWGFAKKGPLKDEDRIIDKVKNGQYFKKDPRMSFRLSLFYNQLSRFNVSNELIDYFAAIWNPGTAALARFYYFYYQGMYEKAIESVEAKRQYLSVNNSVFWQALNYCEEQLFALKKQDIIYEYDNTVAMLQSQLENLRIENASKKGRTAATKTRQTISRIVPNFTKLHVRKVYSSYTKLQNKIVNNKSINSKLLINENFAKSTKPHVLVTMPWMTFGGAETLTYNYCKEIAKDINITFMTGLKSENEWEYKFKEISNNIYHLPLLFEDATMHMEFISKYISTNRVDILHLVHNGFMFDMLPELKKRHPNLKVVLTLFNDRVPEYVAGAIKYQKQIDRYVTDNNKVAISIGGQLPKKAKVTVIPNGIDDIKVFNPELFNGHEQRKKLNIKTGELSVFFIGRLSPEKNPNVFVEAAQLCAVKDKQKKLKFFIVGDGSMREEIEKMITINKSANMTYLGYQEDVAKYLSAADVFILPSSIEGFPLSLLEAMAMNVVPIASDVGAVSDVVATGLDGFVVSPGSAKEISEKITLLAKDSKKLNTMKKLVRKKIEQKYSSRTLGDNYKNLYTEIMK